MGGSQTLPGSLPQGRISLRMPMLCARSPGNWAWLFLSTCQQPGAPGCSSPSPAVAPRARFPPSVPSSSLGPCQRPWCQGRGDTAPVSLNGAERDRGWTQSYLTCAFVTLLLPPLWMIPPCWEDHVGVGCAAGMCIPLLRPHQLTPQCCKPQNKAPKPAQHPISVSSAVFGNS